jgi:predicted DNA-binding transcriptional regulator AlpA
MPKLRARTVYTRDASPSPELAQLAERVAQLERTSQALPTLLTVQDLANLLRTTPNAIKIMLARGQLPPPLDIGLRRLLWPADVVSQWLHRDRERNQ